MSSICNADYGHCIDQKFTLLRTRVSCSAVLSSQIPVKALTNTEAVIFLNSKAPKGERRKRKRSQSLNLDAISRFKEVG